MESPWQNLIPESLLFDIFSCLDIKALGRAARVCKTWQRIVADEFLWQKIAKRTWKIKGGLAPGKSSWYEEVKRLTYHVPNICCETIEKHTDEVLDVSISHCGQYFCTCSKDALVIMWKFGVQSSIVKSFDAGLLLKWQLSQYSVFCPNDSLILVCGVKSYDDIPIDVDTEYRAGVGAVFTVPDLDVVSVVEMDPPTMFGAWLNERVFLGGWPGSRPNTVNIQAYKVSDYEVFHPYKSPDGSGSTFTSGNRVFADISYSRNSSRLFTFQGNRYHLMNLLVANVPVLDTGMCKSTTCDVTESFDAPDEVSMSCGSGTEQQRRKRSPQYDEGFEVPEARKVKVKDFNTCNITNISERACRIYVNSSSDIHVTDRRSCTICNTILSEKSSSGCEFCGNLKGYTVKSEIKLDAESDKLREEEKGNENIDTSVYYDVRKTFSDADNQSKSNLGLHENTQSQCQNIRQYVIFVTKSHDVIAVHEVSKEKLSSVLDLEPDNHHMEELDRYPDVDEIDHSFQLKDCYITGLCLSHDQRYLYFNFREMDKQAPENKVDPSNDGSDEELPVSEKVFCKDLKIGCIDLVAMERVKDIEFSGHVGYSTFPAWYICLDACPDYIGSGSEDMRGYIWDRHYGVCIGRLCHSFLDIGKNTNLAMISMYENSVVNGLSFSPVDQETCVTVCDDRLIKIWRSKHKAKYFRELESKARANKKLRVTLNKLKSAYEAGDEGHS